MQFRSSKVRAAGAAFSLLVASVLTGSALEAQQYPPKTPVRIVVYESKPAPRAAPPTATVEGVIRDPDRRPLAGVAVVALGVGRVAISDADGRFRLARLPAGEIQLQVGDTWLERKTRLLTLAPGDAKRFDLQLHGQTVIWCDQASAEDWAPACRVPVSP